jgi:hypothetical protein
MWLSPCAEKSTRAVALERLDINRTVPPGANDLSQSLRIVLISLVDLHLEGGACVPGEKRLRARDCAVHAPAMASSLRSRSLCGRHLPHAGGPKCSFVLEPWGTGPAIVCGQHCQRRKWPSSSATRPIQQSESSMNLRGCESPGNAARIAALSADQEPTAIIGCPHMTEPGQINRRGSMDLAFRRMDKSRLSGTFLDLDTTGTGLSHNQALQHRQPEGGYQSGPFLRSPVTSQGRV